MLQLKQQTNEKKQLLHLALIEKLRKIALYKKGAGGYVLDMTSMTNYINLAWNL